LGATVWLDTGTNEIRRVEGLITIPGAKTSTDAAEQFLSSSLGLNLKADKTGKTTFVTLARKSESLTGSQLLFQEYYGKTDFPGGLPIFGSTVSVLLNADNGITLVTNNTVRITKSVFIRSSRLLDSEGAEDAARRGLSENDGKASRFTNVGRGVLILRGEPVPVWKMNQLTVTPPGVLEIVVSASTGEILSIENVAQYE